MYLDRTHLRTNEVKADGCGRRFRIPYTVEYVNCGPDQLCEGCATAVVHQDPLVVFS